MAYGNMIAFVLSMLTFIVVSANLENFHVDKHKVEKWNNKQQNEMITEIMMKIQNLKKNERKTQF